MSFKVIEKESKVSERQFEIILYREATDKDGNVVEVEDGREIVSIESLQTRINSIQAVVDDLKAKLNAIKEL